MKRKESKVSLSEEKEKREGDLLKQVRFTEPFLHKFGVRVDCDSDNKTPLYNAC